MMTCEPSFPKRHREKTEKMIFVETEEQNPCRQQTKKPNKGSCEDPPRNADRKQESFSEAHRKRGRNGDESAYPGRKA